MMKSSLIRIKLILILFVLFIPNLVSAELKTFIKEYTYQASEEDSRNSSRTIALREVKRLLLEELGTYLESVTEVQNFKLTKDEITTLTAGIVKTEIVDEKWDGRTYWLKSKIAADANELITSIDSLRKDRAKTKELEDVRKQSNDLLKEIERLRKELSGITGEEKRKNTAAYNKTIVDLSAIEWFEKGTASLASGNSNDAIDAFSKAIDLNPKDSKFYVNRGVAYFNLGNNSQAIENYDKAIELNPKSTVTYYNRALFYVKLGKHTRAIKDFDIAIDLNPKYAVAYSERGNAYYVIGNYSQAIENYDKAIELNPKEAISYVRRGSAYGALGNHKQEIMDYDKAIELNQKDAGVYAQRGIAYANLGNYNQSIKDCDKAIELNPKDALFYARRGISYGALGKHTRAIKDFDKAIDLNPNNTENYVDRGISYGVLGKHKQSIEDFIIAARLGDKKVQEYLGSQGIDWTPQGVPSAASSDKPRQKPEKNLDSPSSPTIPDKTQQKPATDPDDPYKKIKAIVLKSGKVIEGKILILNPEIVKIQTKDGNVSSYSFKNDVQTFITE